MTHEALSAILSSETVPGSDSTSETGKVGSVDSGIAGEAVTATPDPSLTEMLTRLQDAVAAGDLVMAQTPSQELREAHEHIRLLEVRVAELEAELAAATADPDDIVIPSQAKRLCSDLHTLPGMKGFWLCRLDPGHESDHASGDRTWPRCICPDLDRSTLGQAPGTSFLKGRDGRCGMHGETP